MAASKARATSHAICANEPMSQLSNPEARVALALAIAHGDREITSSEELAGFAPVAYIVQRLTTNPTLKNRIMDRRTFVAAGITGAVGHGLPAGSASSGIKAIAFDGLALFDPRPIFVLAEQFFPGKSASLVATWRGRQFDYTWLRTLVGSYVDFLQVTDEALSFAAEAEKAGPWSCTAD